MFVFKRALRFLFQKWKQMINPDCGSRLKIRESGNLGIEMIRLKGNINKIRDVIRILAEFDKK